MFKDFMTGFRMNKVIGFLINNQEPVGLKAINLSYCTRPNKDMTEDIDIDAPLSTNRKPKQTWVMPSNIQRSAFYQSLKELEDNNK